MPAYTPMELAHAFIRAGELQDALEALDTQVAQQPEDDEARRLRAAVLLRVSDTGNLAKAFTDLDTLSEKTPSDYVQLSVLAERLNDIPRAIAVMNQVVALLPEDERLLERLLGLMLRQPDLPAALQLARSQARSWRWLQWEADILTLSGEFVLAAEQYAEVVRQMDERFDRRANRVIGAIRTRVLLAWGYACRRSQQYDTAVKLYQDALKYYSDDLTIAFNLGLIQALRGDVPGGIAICRAALDATTNPELLTEMRQTLQNEPELQALAAELLD
jgi:tetratricopeptide (TPR) repeat protein